MDYVPFFQAAGKGDVATVAALLEQGADPNWTDPNIGNSALYNACTMDKVTTVGALLDGGADPNLRLNYHSPVDGRKENGVVALMYARSADVVAALIAAGADVNVADNNGVTSLIRASFWGKVDVVKALLEAHADQSLRTRKGSTARDVAAARIDEYQTLDVANHDAVAERIKKFNYICDLLDSDSESIA